MKGIVIQILNSTGNHPVLPAQRFYPALRETSSGETRFIRTPSPPFDPLKHQIDTADLKDARECIVFWTLGLA